MKKNILLFFIGVSLLFTSGIKLPILDQKADLYFKDSLYKAGSSYAACRLINGGVSVLKDSELSLEPMGLGVSIAVGQILDPIDDMTERLSDVLVTAMASLGTQKLLHEVAIYLAPVLMGSFILLWLGLSLVSKERTQKSRVFLFKLVVIVAVCRICLPLSALVNEGVYNTIFETQMTTAQSSLPFQNGEVDELADLTMPECDGIWDTTQKSFKLMEQKSVQFKNILATLYEDTSNIIAHLVTLTFLYVGLFVIQVILIPLSIFYLLSKLINSLFNTSIPLILKHAKSSEPVAPCTKTPVLENDSKETELI